MILAVFVMDNLHGALSNTYEDSNPDQTFDKEKHKTGKADPFEPGIEIFFHSIIFAASHMLGLNHSNIKGPEIPMISRFNSLRNDGPGLGRINDGINP